LDGIKNKIDPGEPLNADISAINEGQAEKYPLLPSSLLRALEALRADSDFLREDDVFAETLIDTWIKLKENEVEQIRIRPHPWEFRLYYDA
jgi:glutamine synthetase